MLKGPVKGYIVPYMIKAKILSRAKRISIKLK